MNDFVAKPVDPAVLYAALLKWLPVAAAATVTATAAVPDPARAVDPDTPRRAALARIAGLDVAAGLAIVSGKLSTYLRVLALFVDSHADTARRLRDAFDRDAFDATGNIAHGLKGVAGNIGARALAGTAATLLAALRRGAPDAAAVALAALETDLPPLIAALRGALAETAEPGKAEAEAAKTAEPAAESSGVAARAADRAQPIQDWIALLEADDIAAHNFPVAQRASLEAALGAAQFAAVERAVQRFDYAAALRLLDGRDG